MSRAPPGWIGVDQSWNIYLSGNRHVKVEILKSGLTYNFEAMIENDETLVFVNYVLNNEKIAEHQNRNLLDRRAYVKFGIYRVISKKMKTFS